MTVSINSKLLDAGYGDSIHMLNVKEAIDRLRPDFRDSVYATVAGLRQRFASRNETAASLHPVAVVPVLYRGGQIGSRRRRGGAEIVSEGMTLSGGQTVLAWAILAEVDEVPAINLDNIEDASELLEIAAGGPDALWPARFQAGVLA